MRIFRKKNKMTMAEGSCARNRKEKKKMKNILSQLPIKEPSFAGLQLTRSKQNPFLINIPKSFKTRARERMEEKMIPEDLVRDILSRLPIKYVLRFRCVCRSWSNLTQEPFFARLHLTRSMQNPHKTVISFFESLNSFNVFDLDLDIKETSCIVEILILTQNLEPGLPSNPACITSISSCDGLLCFTQHISSHSSFFFNTLNVFNPITKQGLSLPKSPLQLVYRSNCRAYHGIGFHASRNEYKVVRIIHESNNPYVDVEIWTLGSSFAWRYIGKIPYYITGFWTTAGFFVDGALHWWMDDRHSSIVSMDMGNEKFCNIELPVNGNDLTEMVEWNGCLGVLEFVPTGRCTNVWVLKDYPTKEEGKMMSWTKELCIKLDPLYYRPLLMQKNGEILLLLGGKFLGWYNPENGCRSSKVISFPSSRFYYYRWMGYAPSLVGWRQEVLQPRP